MVGYNLVEVIDQDKLQEILDKFTDATGLAAIITDARGRNITAPSKFTRHCTMVRSSTKGLLGCYASDARLGRLSMKSGRPAMSLCHCGVVDLAAPLIINGVCCGYVLCGQVFLQPPEERTLNKARQRARRFGIEEKEYVESFLEIEVVPEKRVVAAAEMLHIVSSYIVEMGASHLMQAKLLAEERRRIELENALRDLELKALQSQVNPHFLFNTLNTAARLAYLENASRTSEIVYSLASLLRYSLRNIDKLVSLKEEITHIKHYLYIQEVRYKGRIRAVIEIPEHLGDVLLPVMSLQPLVENAIVHGLEKKVEGGEVRIMAYEAGDLVKVEIADNGVGIKREVLERLSQSGPTGTGHTTGLGLLNVDLRLKRYFGSSYGLQLESEPGRGTKVTLVFPKKVEEVTEQVM
ncbi:MAG: sensor histidine kinase [Moorellaceae bacterium]